MLPSEDLKRRNTAAKDWYLFISYASAIIQGPPIFHCDPKFFQLYHSLIDSSMLFFTKFLPKIPGGFSHPNQWAAHRLCKDRLYPFRAGKSARKRSLARVRPKSLPKRRAEPFRAPKRNKIVFWIPFYRMISIPPMYILSASGILTDPSALRLFSKKAINILGGATTVLLRVCAK